MCECLLNIALILLVESKISTIESNLSVPREAENVTPHLGVCHRAALAHVYKVMLLTALFLITAKQCRPLSCMKELGYNGISYSN